jgi:protein CpxP
MLKGKVKQITGALVALLLLVNAGVMAQPAGAVTKAAKAMSDSLAYLQLTDPQKSTADALNKTAATSLLQTAKKAKADTSFRGKALAQQVMGIMKQRNTGLQSVLTPDQQKLFQAHKISQIADVQTKVMTAQLDLTDAQVPQVYKINKDATADMMGDMGKMKSAGGKFAKMKAAKGLKGDMKDKDKELKKVLSPDQYTIFEKHQEEMKAAMKEKMQAKKGK